MDNEKIKQFIISSREQGIPDAEIYSFLQQKGAITQPTAPQPEKKTFVEKVADFTGGKEIGQGLGQAIANKEISQNIEQTQQQQADIQGSLIQKIKEKKAQGGDTTRLENALKLLSEDIAETGEGAGELLNQEGLTTKQVLGDALQLATTIGSVGSYGKGFVSGGKEATLKNVITNTGRKKAIPSAIKGIVEPTSFGKGFLKGAKTGALSGSGFSGATGVSQALQNDRSAAGIIESGIGGAIGGLVLGGIVGGVAGGISGGLKGRALRKAVLDGQIEIGEKVAPKLSAVKQKAVDIAKQQGFDDTDIQFINSMKRQDKLKAQKMIELAQKASVDKRALERPIDVVGDSMVDRIKFIQKQNSAAGKAVNEAAKSLRGEIVNASQVKEKANTLLDDLGISINNSGLDDANTAALEILGEDTTKVGKLDFSKSVFKLNPELQKLVRKFVNAIPEEQTDAYDLHIFKKAIDELVDYGTSGEGLKGNASGLLKQLRSAADDVLDSNFEAYNIANTDFKITKEALEAADDLFGKKTGFVKEKGGQLLRSVFSNNAQRPSVLALIEQLDKTAKQYGGKFDDNLIDQALFTEILEDVYGTQATTSLQGQVKRAVQGTKKAIEGIRDPIKGAGELIARGVEKSVGISDENKKKILSALLK